MFHLRSHFDNLNTHSPNFSVPGLSPNSVHFVFAKSRLEVAEGDPEPSGATLLEGCCPTKGSTDAGILEPSVIKLFGVRVPFRHEE